MFSHRYNSNRKESNVLATIFSLNFDIGRMGCREGKMADCSFCKIKTDFQKARNVESEKFINTKMCRGVAKFGKPDITRQYKLVY